MNIKYINFMRKRKRAQVCKYHLGGFGMEYGDVYDNVFNSVFIALGVLNPIQVTKVL